HGALELGVHELRDGIVSRGVLLDVPRLRGLDWLEPGDPIHPEELEAAERNASLRVEAGDLLLVRTGRWAYRRAHGAWDPHERLAGLHASCLPWLHERRVAALGSDAVSDVVPSGVEGHRLPIHGIAIPILGLHLLDNLDLEGLGRACPEEGRWEFLLTIAPLVIERGTASPVNPIALF
ncbi:MAG: cyclase family protein, partial [Myxococcota bacterium]